jgi:methyl-accepting chemotaxis protein
MNNIKKSTRLTFIVFVVALIAELAVVQVLTRNTKINGEVYRQISADKDLIADILPPPAYLLEAHFVVTAAMTTIKPGADGKSLEMQRLLKESNQHKAALEERQLFWKSNPYINSEIQDTIVNRSSKLGLEYFEVLKTEFLPAAAANDSAAAQLAYAKLNIIYEEQRKVIEGVVEKAAKSVENNENLAQSINADAWVNMIIGTVVLLTLILAVQIYIYKTSVVPLRNIASDLNHGAQESLLAANQVAHASQQLAEGASEQAASVHETSASLEEISSMIHSTANNAIQAKALANEAQEAARSGMANMSEMTRAMSAIEQSSNEVAKIVKTIDEIAFQTNILALNAAVEAARAGEAGAGFAVVADEVRSLAQRSAAAANESSDKIAASIQNSHDGAQTLLRVKESFASIEKKVHQTDNLVAEIAQAAKEQAQGIEHIGAAIEQLSQLTQSNASNAEVSASAAEELSVQSGVNRELTLNMFFLVDGSTGETSKVNSKDEGVARFSPVFLKPAAAKEARASMPHNNSPKLSAPPHAGMESHFKEF